MKKESEFQTELIQQIKAMLPGCKVQKNDPNYLQGIPDWSIYYGPKYAWLECKRSADEPHRPNQDYYVETTNQQGGFARFVYPENKDQVLMELMEFMNN